MDKCLKNNFILYYIILQFNIFNREQIIYINININILMLIKIFNKNYSKKIFMVELKFYRY